MSRWIDADVLLRALAEMWYDSPISVTGISVSELIDKQPSIDIVRCKECKHAHMTYGGDCKHCDMWKDDDDFSLELYLDGDFYCAYGEREGE